MNNSQFGGVSLNPGGGGGGGGCTPIYGLYRYVPRDRVCFLRFERFESCLLKLNYPSLSINKAILKDLSFAVRG